jgi:hypothetical protein
MNPPSLSLAGRDEALLEIATRRNAFFIGLGSALSAFNSQEPTPCHINIIIQKEHTIGSLNSLILHITLLFKNDENLYVSFSLFVEPLWNG